MRFCSQTWHVVRKRLPSYRMLGIRELQLIGWHMEHKITIGIIGGPIRGVIQECVAASGRGERLIFKELGDIRNYGNDERSSSRILTWLRMISRAFNIAWHIRKVDIAILVFVDLFASLYIMAAKLFRKKIVLYWLGSDVDGLVNGLTPLFGINRADLQLAYSNGNIAELSSMGVHGVELMILPTRIPGGISKMPEHHAVLLSIPDSRKEFYGYSDMMRLIDDFPDIPFHIVRSEHPEYYDRPNIQFEGMLNREEMSDLFDRVSIVVRWPEHDGTSLILMESALKGKYIISRNPFPCGTVTSSYDGLKQALSHYLSAPLKPCMENRDYAEKHFVQDAAGEQFAARIEKLLAGN